MPSIPENLKNIRQHIISLEQKYGRIPNSVLLLAVSKTQTAEKVTQAYNAGQNHFAENYLQEALEKIEALQALEIIWHFIGPIQSNKTKTIAENFDWVHSVDRFKIAQRLNNQRPKSRPPLNVFLQVNLSQEESKSGVSLQELPALAKQIQPLTAIEVCGLMAIPAVTQNFEEQCLTFKRLKEARNHLIDEGFINCRFLSMGMSGDYEAAISQGSTHVRIGTAIFGKRD